MLTYIHTYVRTYIHLLFRALALAIVLDGSDHYRGLGTNRSEQKVQESEVSAAAAPQHSIEKGGGHSGQFGLKRTNTIDQKNSLLCEFIHSVWFYKKRWDFTTSDSFLNFWVFPLLGFLNLKAGFLIFEEIIHWFLKNIFFLLLFSAK